MSAEIRIGFAARQALAQGVNQVVRPVGLSFGPLGRGVLQHCPPAAPSLLYDGYAIARAVAEEGGLGGLGSQIAKETLYEIDRDLGDGCSAAAVMIGALVFGGVRLAEAGFATGVLADHLIVLGNRAATIVDAAVCDADPEESLAGAAFAATRDHEVTTALAAAARRVSREGVIKIEEGPGLGVNSRFLDGMSLPASLASAALSDSTEKVEACLDRPYVMVADEDVQEFGALLPVLEGFARSGKALLIATRRVGGDALATLIRNKRELGLRVAAVKLTQVGERASETLSDLAVATGAEVVGACTGTAVDKIHPCMLGRAEEAVLTDALATVIGGGGSDEELEARRGELRRCIEREKYLSYDREQLEERLARLAGGVARLAVGAASASERSARIKAANKGVAAVRALRRGGVLPGGGVALVRAAEAVRREETDDLTRAAAIKLAAQALEAVPARMILNGGVEPARWLERLRAVDNPRVGLDLNRFEITDMISAGIVDGSVIVSSGIKRAFSAAATLLRAEVGIARRP